MPQSTDLVALHTELQLITVSSPRGLFCSVRAISTPGATCRILGHPAWGVLSTIFQLFVFSGIFSFLVYHDSPSSPLLAFGWNYTWYLFAWLIGFSCIYSFCQFGTGEARLQDMPSLLLFLLSPCPGLFLPPGPCPNSKHLAQLPTPGPVTRDA